MISCTFGDDLLAWGLMLMARAL